MLSEADMREFDQRTDRRFPIDEEAWLLLVESGAQIPCRLLNLSMGGCCVESHFEFRVALHLRTEVHFRARGLSFRLLGLTRWNKRQRQIGIQFIALNERRREDLAVALAEVEAAKAAAEALVAAPLAGQAPSASEQVIGPDSPPAGNNSQEKNVAVVKAGGCARAPAFRERRAQVRYAVDVAARLVLVKSGARIEGRILNLSLSGCQFRSHERFPVGIYTRIEVEFAMHGIPFRLGGVVQAIHNRQTAGVRFLDMSARKLAQIEGLIEEYKQAHADLAPGAGHTAL